MEIPGMPRPLAHHPHAHGSGIVTLPNWKAGLRQGMDSYKEATLHFDGGGAVPTEENPDQSANWERPSYKTVTPSTSYMDQYNAQQAAKPSPDAITAYINKINQLATKPWTTNKTTGSTPPTVAPPPPPTVVPPSGGDSGVAPPPPPTVVPPSGGDSGNAGGGGSSTGLVGAPPAGSTYVSGTPVTNSGIFAGLDPTQVNNILNTNPNNFSTIGGDTTPSGLPSGAMSTSQVSDYVNSFSNPNDPLSLDTNPITDPSTLTVMPNPNDTGNSGSVNWGTAAWDAAKIGANMVVPGLGTLLNGGEKLLNAVSPSTKLDPIYSKGTPNLSPPDMVLNSNLDVSGILNKDVAAAAAGQSATPDTSTPGSPTIAQMLADPSLMPQSGDPSLSPLNSDYVPSATSPDTSTFGSSLSNDSSTSQYNTFDPTLLGDMFTAYGSIGEANIDPFFSQFANGRKGGHVHSYAHGGNIHQGLGSTHEYAAGGKLLRGPGDGMSDSIPAVIHGNKPQRAALADGEFVVPADVVSHLGNGSTEAGSRKLYEMMDKVRMARTGRKKQAPAVKSHKFLPV